MCQGHLHEPRKLEHSDRRADFASGAEELDDWFHRYAWQNQQANNAVVYVATVDAVVVGYYALCSGGIEREQVPEKLGKGRPDPIPVILLARLAVDQRAQGRGLGAALFRDAIARALNASDGIGAAALLIHARDEDARAFYQRLADVVPSPVDPLHLVLPVKVARAATS